MSSTPKLLGDFLAYRCGSCKEWCLEVADKPWSQAHECPDCFAVPDLSASRSPTPSEGEGAEGTSAAGLPRPEATGVERGLASDHAARAHRPTPEGEGGTCQSALTEFTVLAANR